ncbi:MAG: hypothetical protein H7282_01550 [Cytophagaceae bacterium]|nr:hypothetical protein [Cytophagaceae bacterium]
MKKKTILVVCDDNVIYSKLAEAYLIKFAGHWKNTFSAGINITDKKVSPDLKIILTEDQLENSIAYSLKNIKDFEINSYDYILALTPNAHEYCKNNIPKKEIALLTINSLKTEQVESVYEVSKEIKSELLKFVKNGPIKRWIEFN